MVPSGKMVVDKGRFPQPCSCHDFADQFLREQSQMELPDGSPSNVTSSQQGYINLIKASWILIDVIARHPQLNLLDSGIRFDVELLANVCLLS